MKTKTVTESFMNSIRETEVSLRKGNRYTLINEGYWMGIWERDAREYGEEKELLSELNNWNVEHGERPADDLSTAIMKAQFALSDIYYEALRKGNEL